MSEAIVQTIITDLIGAGDASKKAWWESYLKDVIEFHGVPMAAVRSIVRRRISDESMDRSDRFDTAYSLLQRPIADEKLAGILILAELVDPPISKELDRIGRLFDDGHIWDWNTCDWLCIKVLGPAVRHGGVVALHELVAWHSSGSLWRRRASIVGLVPLAAKGDAEFEGLTSLVLDTSAALARDDERFIQTGIGWTLRELSDASPDRVFSFLTDHRDTLSTEAIRMAAARLSDEQRQDLGVTGKRRRR